MIVDFLAFVALIVVIIGTHEGGHFVAARLYGVPVRAFAVGLGPVVAQRTDSRGTAWQIRAIPLGGLVDIEPQILAEVPPLRRAVLYLAGPCVNLAVGASVLMCLALSHGHGVAFSAAATAELVGSMGGGLAETIASPSAADVGGPIAIAEMAGNAVRDSGVSVAVLVAIISVSVGFLNLLPVPVLDGGQTILCLVEWLRGRPPSPSTTKTLNLVGVVFIVSLIVFALGSDLFRIFSVGG
jgi:membrane-associated protease RseP (regulator of RpoE activity)